MSKLVHKSEARRRNGHVSLNEDIVKQTAFQFKLGVPMKRISKNLSVGLTPVSDICKGKIYSQLSGLDPESYVNLSGRKPGQTRRLKVKTVLQIRDYIRDGYTNASIAAEMGVGVAIVRDIANGSAYRDVSGWQPNFPGTTDDSLDVKSPSLKGV